MNEPTMLGLPVELQQQIMKHVEDRDLLALRRTCKELRAAARYPFSHVYLADLRALILNPARLLRLKNILTTPELAEDVQWITLTSYAFEEGYEQMAIVAPQDTSQTEAEEEWINAYSSSKYEELAGYQSLDWAAVSSILQAVSASRTAKLRLEFHAEDPVYKSLSSRCPHLPQDFLEATRTTGALGRLNAVSLSGAYQINELALLGPDSALLTRDDAQNLEDFQFACHTREEAERHLPAVVSVLRATSSRLATWSFGTEAYNEHTDVDELIVLPASFWSVGHLDGLNAIWLTGLRIEGSKEFFEMIKRCSHNLRKLQLAALCMVEDGEPWQCVIHQLALMPQLVQIDLACPSQQSPRIPLREAYMCTSDYHPEDPNPNQSLYETTKKKTQKAIHATIQYGITYKPIR